LLNDNDDTIGAAFMNLYPAIRFTMGQWTYYSVKMSMRELSENVHFASEVYPDRTLDEAIQRALNEKRVKSQIVTYLTRQPFRFFSSLVVAAMKGDPRFYPVRISDEPQFEFFADDKRLNETFGVLKFDGSQDYYALDGQHRLAAIKTLLDPEAPESDNTPEGFADDEISVIVVVQKVGESNETFMQRYRRLFSNLNRYAKAMDQATNIIMDEDDAFAVITRRLITDHEFFRSEGRHRESRKVKTEKGKNLRPTDSFFTSIETLYEMNIAMLSSRKRVNAGWGNSDAPEPKLDDFKRFRPEEQVIDNLDVELKVYWDGLLKEIPDLWRNPPEMRVHSLDDGGGDEEATDHLLFWPIGQQMLAELVRDLLDQRQADPEHPSSETVGRAIRGLGGMEWRLHRPPWRYFLLTQDEKDNWKMRDEDRTKAVRIARRIAAWIMGEELDDEGVAELRQQWSIRLIPNPRQKDEKDLWGAVEKQRATISELLGA